MKQPRNTTGKKRDRRIARDPRLPHYASQKKTSNQINPIAFIAVGDADKSLSAVFCVRKLIVESKEGKPLDPTYVVKSSEAKALISSIERSVYRGGTRTDENIVRALVGKEEYINWFDHYRIDIDQSIYNLMTPDEINALSLYKYFKDVDGYFSNPYWELPTILARVSKGDSEFMHPTRGRQEIHSHVEFIDDWTPPIDPEIFDEDAATGILSSVECRNCSSIIKDFYKDGAGIEITDKQYITRLKRAMGLDADACTVIDVDATLQRAIDFEKTIAQASVHAR